LEFYGTQSGVTGYVFGGVDGERMRINSSGSVEVKGGQELRVYRGDNATYGSIKYLTGSGGLQLNDKNGDGISFVQADGATEYMRIDSSGNLLVGTTTGTIDTANFGTSISADGRILSSGNRGATVSAHIFYGNAGQAIIKGDGDLENTNNSYGAVSDIKLKENITDATPKLSGLLDVRVVNYNLIAQPDVKQIGVIAQELEIIFPALVKESPDLDDDGEDLGTTTKSVKYSVFVPMLIKAIQEQQTIIESLEARITALES
jgi:hypothetical protein